MTTLNEAREAIYQRFNDNFTGLPLSETTFDNEDFTPPDGPWVRLTVRQAGGGQETLGAKGNRSYRRIAGTFAQVHTLADQGTAEADGIAQEILAIFEGESFSDLDFNDGVIREIGSDGRFYQEVVEINFDYDERK